MQRKAKKQLRTCEEATGHLWGDSANVYTHNKIPAVDSILTRDHLHHRPLDLECGSSAHDLRKKFQTRQRGKELSHQCLKCETLTAHGERSVGCGVQLQPIHSPKLKGHSMTASPPVSAMVTLVETTSWQNRPSNAPWEKRHAN